MFTKTPLRAGFLCHTREVLSIAAIGFGLIIGSFTNVLISRMGTGESLGGRSHCPHCKTQLKWYELVPVFSWIVLRRRCRSCTSLISWQYPLVESATALGFLLFVHAPLAPFQLVLACCMLVLAIAIFVYDLYYTLIPDAWNYPLAALSLLYGLTVMVPDYPLALFLLAGPIAALPLFGLWAVSRGAWMGFGDVKLALSMGWILGPWTGFVSVFFAFVIGAVVSVGILLPLPHLLTFAQKLGMKSGSSSPAFTMKSEVPFGPFLILSLFFLWFAALYGVSLPLLLL